MRPASTAHSPSSLPLISLARFAHALTPYPGAPGHYPHEVLPRLLWLHQTLPPEVPIVVPIVAKYIDALVARGVLRRDRLIPYDPSKLYFGQEVYYVNE